MPELLAIQIVKLELHLPGLQQQMSMPTCIQVRRIMIHFCTLYALLQSTRVTFIAFVITHLPSRHLSPQTNTQGCFVTVSFNRHERERERGEENCCASMHSFYMTSLWCETTQYSGFGATAFPDQWRLNTLSSGPCSGMAEMQIFHAPEIKSFQYLLNQKRIYFSFYFQPVRRYLPGAMRGSTAKIHSTCSTCICRATQKDIQTFKTLSIFYDSPY